MRPVLDFVYKSVYVCVCVRMYTREKERGVGMSSTNCCEGTQDVSDISLTDRSLSLCVVVVHVTYREGHCSGRNVDLRQGASCCARFGGSSWHREPVPAGMA